MLELLKRKNGHVLVLIDEVSSSKNIRSFIHTFQKKTLTFLYRAPKIELEALDLMKIATSYQNIFNINALDAKNLAFLTNGYAYAYQVLGSLLWKRNNIAIDDELLAQFDEILAKNSYNKIYTELPKKEQEILNALACSQNNTNAEILDTINIKKNELSVYKSRLSQKGIINTSQRGVINFTLPRFKEFVKKIADFYS